MHKTLSHQTRSSGVREPKAISGQVSSIKVDNMIYYV